MHLPWARILSDDEVIESSDYTCCQSVFWEDGWVLVPDEVIGMKVERANYSDMDAAERVYVRPHAHLI